MLFLIRTGDLKDEGLDSSHAKDIHYFRVGPRRDRSTRVSSFDSSYRANSRGLRTDFGRLRVGVS